MPILRRTLVMSYPGAVMTSPSSVTVPEVGSSSRFRHRSSVDFPVPDGPMTAITSPALISAHTSSSGVTLG